MSAFVVFCYRLGLNHNSAKWRKASIEGFKKSILSLCFMFSAVDQAKWDSVLESPGKKIIQLVKSTLPFLPVLMLLSKRQEQKINKSTEHIPRSGIDCKVEKKNLNRYFKLNGLQINCSAGYVLCLKD